MKTLMKSLAVAAMTVAMLAPAKAGSNECSGPIVTDKEWIRINEELNERPCRVKLNSNLGRRVLAVCPVGANCTLYLPIQGSAKVMAMDDKRTVIKVDSIDNEDVRDIAIVRTMLKKCTGKLSADQLLKVSAAHEVMAERKKINLYGEHTIAKAIKETEQQLKDDPLFCESMWGSRDWNHFTN